MAGMLRSSQQGHSDQPLDRDQTSTCLNFRLNAYTYVLNAYTYTLNAYTYALRRRR
jgi:hypothetical protein